MPTNKPNKPQMPMKSDNPPPPASSELMKAIIDEVDEAREVLELAQQLAPALPLRSFEDLHKAVGQQGKIIFRGNAFNVRAFEALVPSLFFPIDDLPKLIALLYETVRLAPTTVTYSDKDPEHAKRRLRRLGIVGMLGKIGQLGFPSGVPARSAASTTTTEQPLPEKE
jgi:hypothetical protein